MSVHRVTDETSKDWDWGAECSFCNNPIRDVVVVWRGPDLVLHWTCARDLAARLAMDATHGYLLQRGLVGSFDDQTRQGSADL